MLSPHGYYSIILFILQDFSECRGKIISVTLHSPFTPACDRRPYPPPPRPRKTTRSGRKPTQKRAKKNRPGRTGTASNLASFVFLHALRQNHERQQEEEQNYIHCTTHFQAVSRSYCLHVGVFFTSSRISFTAAAMALQVLL